MIRRNLFGKPWIHAYLDRPRVKPVALLTSLDISVTLLRSLMSAPAFSDGPALFHPLRALLIVVVAVSWIALILWSIRPGQRRWWELGALIVSSGFFAYLAVAGDRPASVMLVLTATLRYWQPLGRTLGLFFALLPISILLYHWTGSAAAYGYGTDWSQILLLLVYTFAQGAFAYAAFEFMLRNEEKKRELEAALAQLQEYRGLELRHAALQERAHLSRELHDTLGHHLTVLRLEAQRARKLTQRSGLDNAEITQALTQVVQRSGDSLSQLQEIVSTLKTPQLNGTLYQALGDLVQHWPGQVELSIEGEEPELPSQHQLSVYRSLQEALTNAYKYAQGQPVQARLRQIGECLELSVRNPCVCSGAETALPIISGGHGLSGLRARLEALGGKLSIDQSGEVFELCLSLPIPR